MRFLGFERDVTGALLPFFALALVGIMAAVILAVDARHVLNKSAEIKSRVDSAALVTLADTDGLILGEGQNLQDAFNNFFNSQLGDSSNITLVNTSITHHELIDGTASTVVDYEVAVNRLMLDDTVTVSDQVVLSETRSVIEGCDPNVHPVGYAEEILPGECVQGTHGIPCMYPNDQELGPDDQENVYDIANVFHETGALWHNQKVDLRVPGQYKALVKSVVNDHIAFGFHNDPRGLNTIPTALAWAAPGTIQNSVQLLIYGRYSRSVSLATNDWNKRCCWNTHYRSAYDYDNFEEIILTWDPFEQELSYQFHDLTGTMEIDLIDYVGAEQVYVGLHAGTGGYPGTHMGCIWGTQPGPTAVAFISE